MAFARQRIPEPAFWVACIHMPSLDFEDMHAHLLHPLNVGINGHVAKHQCANYDSDNVTHMKIRIRIGAVFLATTFLATFLTILLGCYPIKKHWQINPDPGSTNSHRAYYSTCAHADRD